LRYTHLTSESKDSAIDRINALMNGITISWGNIK
jgi:hypothetical protein